MEWNGMELLDDSRRDGVSKWLWIWGEKIYGEREILVSF